MPTKQLTIDIPEPIEGRCSSDCPMRQADELRDFCAAGADMDSWNANDYDLCLVPGPGCPQYQDKKVAP